ncbi:MAG: hypothetical protein LBI39_00890 [Puniceicoccales bacterium]|jgi:hypothetical protein|nr:hypothetical protein [Puniceicoccales bacterium]
MENSEKQNPPGASLAQLLFAHWRKILGVLLILCLAASAKYALDGWRNFRLLRAQREFTALQSKPFALADFVSRYGSLPIGALASFSMANGAAKGGDNLAAADAYGRCGPLEKARLDGVASIAEALSFAKGGDGVSAGRILSSLCDDFEQPVSVRAAANYFLALLLFESGQMDGARAALDSMGRLPEQYCRPWATKSALLAMAIQH